MIIDKQNKKRFFLIVYCMNDMHIDFKAAQSWSEIQGSLSSYSVLL